MKKQFDMNTPKIFLSLAALIFSINIAQAQIPQVSQYYLNNYLFNPSFAGADGELEAMISYRKDFAGFEDGPETQMLTFEMPFKKEKFGIGASLYNNTFGPQRRTAFQLSYAYHLRLQNNFLISMGLGGNLYNNSLDFLSMANGNDIIDPALLNGTENTTSFDATAGINLRTEDFFTSFSVMNLIETENKFSDGTNSAYQDNARHFFWMTGFTIPIIDSVLDLEPSILIKYTAGNSPQADLNARFIYKNMFWGAFSYRARNTYVAAVGVRIKDMIDLGYSYDIHTGQIADLGGPSHEITLRFRRNLSEAKAPEEDSLMIVDALLDTVPEIDTTEEIAIAPIDTIPEIDTTEVEPIVENVVKPIDTVVKSDPIIPAKEEIVKEVIEPVVEEVVPEKPTTPVLTTTQYKGYTIEEYNDANPYKYVVAESFSNVDNAVELRNQLAAKGYDAQIIHHKSRNFYRVTLHKDLDSNKAGDKMLQYRKELNNPGIWVLEQKSYAKNAQQLEANEQKIIKEAKKAPPVVETKTIEGEKVEVLDQNNKYYHIIVGSFGSMENAKKLKAQLEAKNQTVKILEDKDRNLYRVSIFSGLDADEARQKLLEAQENIAEGAWLYKKG